MDPVAALLVLFLTLLLVAIAAGFTILAIWAIGAVGVLSHRMIAVVIDKRWNTIWRGHVIEARRVIRMGIANELLIDGQVVSTGGGWLFGALDHDGRQVEVRVLVHERDDECSAHIFVDGVLVGGERVPDEVVLPPELCVVASDPLAKLAPLLASIHERAGDEQAVREAAAKLERALRERARVLTELDTLGDDALAPARQEHEMDFERLSSELRALYLALVDRASAAPDTGVEDVLLRIQAEKEIDESERRLTARHAAARARGAEA